MTDVPLIPLDILFGNPERVGPQLSRDGARLAFLAPVDGVLNVWVGLVRDGVAGCKPVTSDRARGIRQFFWAHDDRHLVYLQDTGGDENWRVFTVDLDSGEEVDRTPFAGVQAVIVGTSHTKPDEILVGLNKDDARLHDVYSLRLSTGELTKILVNPGYQEWLVDHDLNVRGAVEPRADGGVDYVVRDGDGFKPAFTTPPDDMVINVTGFITFTGDNSAMWCSSVRDTDTARLVKVDLATGEETVVAEHPDRDFTLLHAEFHPETYEPQLVTFATDRFSYVVVDPALQPDIDALRAQLDGDVHVTSWDRTQRQWLIAEVSDTKPVRYYTWDRATQALTFLFDNQPALSDYTLASVVPFEFDARDGLHVHGYITFPPNVERTNLPAVVSVHGGPWGGRDEWGLNPESQMFANRGYACIQVNYRGSGGYGKTFLNCSAREWAGKMHTDLIDGLEYAIGQGWVDRERVAIYGGSYGGYAALVGAAFTPDVFKCAVDYVGPSNLITLLKSIPPYWFGVATQFTKLLGHPDTDNDFLWERSPLSRVDDIRIPMLIAQGANDPRVKQAESEQIVAALDKAGVPYEYLLFDDEGHGFVRPENRLVYYGRVEAFLAEHLGGRSST
jgi:dipeptidyl aminopeptidase/acylaminoacyl peptidase